MSASCAAKLLARAGASRRTAVACRPSPFHRGGRVGRYCWQCLSTTRSIVTLEPSNGRVVVPATTATTAAANKNASSSSGGKRRNLLRYHRCHSLFSVSKVSFSTTPYLSSVEQKLSDMAFLQQQEEPEFDWDALNALAQQTPTPLRLADMYRYARTDQASEQRLRNAQFLYKELPIRIAQRAVDLLTLPHGLNQATAIRQVAHVYIRYLRRFEECPVPKTMAEEEAFTDMLEKMVLDRTSIPMAIAQGVMAWRDDRRKDLDPKRVQEMEDALYRFFTARVGLRFLIVHHILSATNREITSPPLLEKKAMFASVADSDTVVGCIQTDCDPIKEIQSVAKQVTRQTLDCYGVCPEIDIVDCMGEKKRPFTYVPHHLQYMLVELLKNSCRATVRTHYGNAAVASNSSDEIPHLDPLAISMTDDGEISGGRSNKKKSASSSTLPPISVVVVQGDEDVTIKIADKGGGIPRSRMSRIWRFAHSTADQEEGFTEFGTDTVTGGQMRGFGLPLARIYANYFGGELTLKSMEGYGLDAYLHLPRLGDSCEMLPLRVSASPGEGDSTPPPPLGTLNAARTFSTFVRQQQQQGLQSCSGSGTKREPPVDDGGTGPIEEESWEHIRIRRILDVLQSRAL